MTSSRKSTLIQERPIGPEAASALRVLAEALGRQAARELVESTEGLPTRDEVENEP